MSETAPEVLTLSYAVEESVEWRRVGRAAALVLCLYALPVIVASVSLAVSYTLLSGSARALWVQTLKLGVQGAAMIAIAITSGLYWHRGRARSGLVWSLILYVVGYLVVALITVGVGLVTLLRNFPTNSGSYETGFLIAHVFSTAANCIVPVSAIWLFTRPQIRHVA